MNMRLLLLIAILAHATAIRTPSPSTVSDAKRSLETQGWFGGLLSSKPTPAAPAQRTRSVSQHDVATHATAVHAANTESTPYEKAMEALTLLFPVWTVGFSLLALWRPSLFGWISTEPVFHVHLFGMEVSYDGYAFLLSIVLMGMGSTLTPKDFTRLGQHLRPLAAAWALQFLLKPSLAFGIGEALGLPRAHIVGLILLSCSPVAQAANTASFIARGDLPTSMALTLASALLSSFTTPLLFSLFAHKHSVALNFDALPLLLSLLQVSVIPASIGVALNYYYPDTTKSFHQATPLLSVLLTSFLGAASVAGTAGELTITGWGLVPAVLLLQSLSMLAGYLVPRRLLGMTEACSRSLAMQTGMQSAATGYLLARRHFDDVAVSVPLAMGVFSIPLVCSAAASAWRNFPVL